MVPNYSIDDLEGWDERIREKVEEFGLDPYPQEFEICDHNDMLGYMTYSGMPSHYPHWSYGKSFEKTKTMYDHGVSGLPYEMVINSNPSLGYLMRDNTLCLQILTIAHVYGHNDFFKNNFNFTAVTRADSTLSMFKAHAQRVRSYVEDPSIGPDAVERILDAAHSLSMQLRRNRAVKRLSEAEEKQRLWEDAQPQPDPYRRIHRTPDYEAPDLRKTPASPEEDVLAFIRDYNPYLTEWERDLLTIVHEEACYFLPQIETKIMNEGWASYWHREIMNSLDLPQELHLEFLVRHNQVVRPHPGSLNPYHLGLRVWDEIEGREAPSPPEEREDAGPPPAGDRSAMFAVREVDRDVSFLRRFLNEKVMTDLDLFEYEKQDDKLVVSKVSNEDHWREIKATLLRGVGMGSTPIIRITDADFGDQRTLYLVHEHEGRDLELGYAEKTLMHLHELWGRETALETYVNEKRTILKYDDDGFKAEAAS
ncbi:MAG: SpoVR family protein [Candidatus Binatia bacterium]|nr:SpoVR family protein [Candidatus Binatia bacterium]